MGITLAKRLASVRSAALLLGAASLPLGGCTSLLGASVAEPAVAVPDTWSMPVAPVTVDLAEYWTLLDDPLVTEFVAAAIENNRDLAAAAARVRVARAGVKSSRAGYFPQIGANAGVQRDIGDFASDDYTFSVGADARWEADLFGSIGFDVAASKADLLAAGYSLADLQRLIVGQVAQTTISARALALQLAIARETLSIQDENLQIARWRLEAGLVSSLDVEQARTQRAQTAASIPALERDLAAAANTISTLIGEAPGPVLDRFEGSETIPVPPELLGYAMPAEVLRNRPDVRQAEATLISDTARIGLARSQLFPMLSLTGNIGTAAIRTGDLFDIITGGLFAGISQLIFDGGRTAAQIEASRARAAASLAGWEQAILLALEDVESANVALRAARQRVGLFEEALDAASNAALLARSQYQAGLIDFETLLLAENQLLSARNALAASEAERANAFVRLTQALGGGWTDGTVAPAPDNSEYPERIEP